MWSGPERLGNVSMKMMSPGRSGSFGSSSLRGVLLPVLLEVGQERADAPLIDVRVGDAFLIIGNARAALRDVLVQRLLEIEPGVAHRRE